MSTLLARMIVILVVLRSISSFTNVVVIKYPVVNQNTLQQAITMSKATPEDVITEIVNKADKTPYRGVFIYPDLTDFSKGNPVGMVFLATNLVYTWAGYVVFQQGQTWFSLTVELASVASCYYHWTQLEYGPNSIKVVKALLVDYVIAGLTVTAFLITLYEASIHSPAPPIGSFALGLAGVVCLVLSWVYHFGMPYIVFHGLWHVLSGSASATLPDIPTM